MLAKKALKKVLVATLLGSVLIPSAAFADSDYEKQLDQQYGPENGYSVFYNAPLHDEKSLQSVQPLSTGFKWSANYEVTTHYQIPRNISVSNGESIQVISTGSRNTGSNSTYDLGMEYYDSWAGGWYGSNSMTKTADVGSTSYLHWENMEGKDYRVRVKGNVKGSMTVNVY
ncbi:hypothetical protein [Paenibacillus polymyxa]|uniref:hypothetical protein n=1 Tax=Paenibacillus polymyxa TaxID=1406 RepID=UPI0020243A14|nr:hypothetical protein [Paenibacillus polymyxa]WDZ59281.1 hypothetical protein MF626_08555 [Paenibacillus polymyxa]